MTSPVWSSSRQVCCFVLGVVCQAVSVTVCWVTTKMAAHGRDFNLNASKNLESLCVRWLNPISVSIPDAKIPSQTWTKLCGLPGLTQFPDKITLPAEQQ